MNEEGGVVGGGLTEFLEPPSFENQLSGNCIQDFLGKQSPFQKENMCAPSTIQLSSSDNGSCQRGPFESVLGEKSKY